MYVPKGNLGSWVLTVFLPGLQGDQREGPDRRLCRERVQDRGRPASNHSPAVWELPMEQTLRKGQA